MFFLAATILAVPGLVLIALLSPCIILYIWAPEGEEEDQVMIGRWVSLVLYSYVEECCSSNLQPYSIAADANLADDALEPHQPHIVPEADRPIASVHSTRHKCFMRAALGTRDKLMQETSALMVVTSLLANTALQLAQAAAPPKTGLDTPGATAQASSAINKAWQLLAILAFICSMLQLALGAMIGLFTVGRTPRTFMRFIFWGEFLVRSSVSCFLTSVLFLTGASLLYLFRLTENGFNKVQRTFLVSFLGAGGCLTCAFAFGLMTLQKVYEKKGRVVHRHALLSLEPFLSYNYKHAAGMPWDGGRRKWPPLRAYLQMSQRKSSALEYAFVQVCFGLGPVSAFVGLPTVWEFYCKERKALQEEAHQHRQAAIEGLQLQPLQERAAGQEGHQPSGSEDDELAKLPEP